MRAAQTAFLLLLFSSIFHAALNLPPNPPQAPVLAPSEIQLSGTTSCANCALPAPYDPEFQDVRVEYLWHVNGAQVGGWEASPPASFAFACSSPGCSLGGQIVLKVRACDVPASPAPPSSGSCSGAVSSNTVAVVPATLCASAGGNAQYFVMAIMAAFLLVAVAYMATYVFDSVMR